MILIALTLLLTSISEAFIGTRNFYVAMTFAILFKSLAVLTHPWALLAYIVGPPLLAFFRGRRVWVWLLAGVLLGPFGFWVLALPREVKSAAAT